ncbi:hypothetical protein [Flagellimonas flava]|nr:hypothetical protein [Allomuricauda flava]
MRKLALYALVCGWVFLNVNCGKDDDPNTTSDDVNPPVSEVFYNITQTTINDDAYTAPGELSFLYSLNNGGSYTAEIPKDLSKGDELWVKINNGEVDIYEEDFYFDWSGSSIAPADTESDVAKFVIKESDLTISASVTDKVELLVSNRDTGQFYVLDLTDGGLTPAFTAMKTVEEPLIRIRGVVYNYNDGQLYVSTTSFGADRSKLYSIDPTNFQAKLRNENNDENDNKIWEKITDLIISPENSILATLEIQFPFVSALASFDSSGLLNESIDFNGDDFPCCGLGLTYGGSNQEIIVGTGNLDQIKIYKSNLTLTELEVMVLTMEGFSNENPVDYEIRNLIHNDSGIIYALLHEFSETTNTHIAQVDLENNKLIHIHQIGTGGQQRYNGLAAIPAYAF